MDYQTFDRYKIQIITPVNLLDFLIDEFAKIAGKAGGNYGKTLPDATDGPGRGYWLQVTQVLHRVADEIIYTLDAAKSEKRNRVELCLTFQPDLAKRPDFQEFLKKELAAVATRRSKSAWEMYGQPGREEELESGPAIIARMRDQICEWSQPRLPLPEGTITVSPLVGSPDPNDALLAKARDYARQNGRITVTQLRQHLGIGYNKAGELLNLLAAEGTIAREEPETTEA